jgi:thiosulfate reductase cytochrome b subunit
VKTTAYVLSIICVIIAIMYFVLPGGSLPTFLPGYVAGSTHIHKMHGFAAATGAIVFLLIALSTRRARA